MSESSKQMLERAEMRWMSVEDAEITVPARALVELGRDWKAAEAEVARLKEKLDEANAQWHRIRDLHADAVSEVARLMKEET